MATGGLCIFSLGEEIQLSSRIIFFRLVDMFSFDQNKNHVSPYRMGGFHAQLKSNVEFMGGN